MTIEFRPKEFDFDKDTIKQSIGIILIIIGYILALLSLRNYVMCFLPFIAFIIIITGLWYQLNNFDLLPSLLLSGMSNILIPISFIILLSIYNNRLWLHAISIIFLASTFSLTYIITGICYAIKINNRYYQKILHLILFFELVVMFYAGAIMSMS